MSAVWISVVVVGLATIAIKAAGPLLLARRTPPPRAQAALEHLAPALLAALVVTQALGGDNGGFTIDARLAGLAAAAAALLLRAPLLVVITAAGFSEASVKAQFGDIEFVAKPPPVQGLLDAIRRRCGEAIH